ncbi:FG-GAP repeat domain-containing protein [Henriciella mobilis]|uniref:VCBS repeat-containing protein n=1 Tax=Henriciella mobilis TaxID=2305467 RepID=A0A399R666_9PROT|nr:VCBS repeat-containing protein [Henriciella mobilis]RIJ26850.1 VCBS repeat-containing protein [Henriciella mobilis]
MRRAGVSTLVLAMAACAHTPPTELSVADTPTRAQAPNGQFISWVEHRIDDEGMNGGVPIRGGDGLQMADMDGDGRADIVSVHEDSNHLRIAFATDDPDVWVNVTIGEGAEVAAIEDAAVGDLNGDGWPDLVAACEEAHLIYFENPGAAARSAPWQKLIPPVTQDRGSWLRTFIADVDGDGRMDVLGANKGASDIIDPSLPSAARPTSLFLIEGDPLEPSSWREQVLSRETVPNTAMPVDVDGDGDLDVLAAARLRQTMTMLENTWPREGGGIEVAPHPIKIAPGFKVPANWKGTSSGFQTDFADIDGDGRLDLAVAVHETPSAIEGTPLMAGLGWLKQPGSLDEPWVYHRIGDILPDVVIGIELADIDGDGDLDAVTGGYSGLNILKGGYSGASRDFDEPGVTPSSSAGRIAWFENSGDPAATWTRHDISRRVRGMYDAFIATDMDGDGDLDLVTTRGNSGEYDGVIWLEQVRSSGPRSAFAPARETESRALPLPPENWAENYETDMTLIAPNKAGE